MSETDTPRLAPNEADIAQLHYRKPVTFRHRGDSLLYVAPDFRELIHVAGPVTTNISASP